MSLKLTPNEAEFLKRNQDYFGEYLLNDPPFRSLGMRIEFLGEHSLNKNGLLFEDKAWTWNSINKESNKIANYFLEKGLNPGETVDIMLENSPEFIFAMTGVNKIRGIGSLINVNLRKKALIHAIKISEPRFIVTDGVSLPAIIDVFNDLNLKNTDICIVNNYKQKKHNFVDLPLELNSVSSSNPIITPKAGLLDISNYIYTSGTTGFPKAVLNRNNGQGFGYASVLRMKKDDVLYNPLPLYHSHSNQGWRAVTYSGSTLALRKRFSASEYWKDVNKFGATCTLYIGELPRYLLNRPKSEFVPGPLKRMFGLGLRKDIWEEFKTRFQIESIVEFYGGTELGVPFINLDNVPGMVGRKITPIIEIAKIDEDTGEFLRDENGYCIKCKPNEIGMVFIKINYDSNYTLYKSKESTNKKIILNAFEKDDAFLKSGDLVQLHDDYWVSFADRVGDTFRWKGENVSTLEVESILNTFPSIELCNVYGVEVPKHDGKVGMVAIKLEKSMNFNPKELSRFVVENFPNYSIPHFIRIKDELEFTGTHKLRKVRLRKQGYNIEVVKDRMYFWDSKNKNYNEFDKKSYTDIMDGNIYI